MMQEKHDEMDDFALVRFTTMDGKISEVWLPPILAVVCVLYCPEEFDEDIYSARVVWMKDQNSRAWDMSA